MAKFPIHKSIFKQSGFTLNFPHLSRLSRTASNSPYTYGHGTTQLGKLNKYNQMEYIPAGGTGEEVITAFEKQKQSSKNYWLYGTNNRII